jgi:hypothetical protein
MAISGISSDNLMYRLIGQLLDQVKQSSDVVNQSAVTETSQQISEIVVETSSEGHIDVRA